MKKFWQRTSQKSGITKSGAAAPKKRRRRRLPKRLSHEEVTALLEQPDVTTWRGLRNRCMLEIMYRAGLRVSEVVALMPKDVGIDRDGNGVVHVWEGKGGVDRTSYFDPERVMPMLDLWLTKRAALGFGQDKRLFCAARGKPLTTRSVQLMVARHRDDAGIEFRATPHTLRHTFASELIEDGFSTREVQELLGHASVATTELYTHISADRLAAKVRDRQTIE